MRKMKDSGIEWIGEIPESWEALCFKKVIINNDGGVWGDDPTNTENDKIVIRSTEQTVDGKWCILNPAKRDLSSENYTNSRIKKDDLLMTKSSGSTDHIGKTTIADIYFENNECYYSNFIQRIRCNTSLYNPKYAWYILNSSIARSQFVYLQNSTSGIGNINSEIINQIKTPFPPLSEQQRITDFLDKKCTEIDTVIAKTKATIEEYKKLKQSIITEAVTKGLNPNAKMKDSGIEWIGEIPEDWEVKKLKPFLKWKSIKGCGKEVVLSLYRDYGVLPKDSRDDNHNVTSLDTDSYKLVDIGDFVINKMKAWQGSMAVSNFRGIVSPAYHVCSFTSPKIYKPYFHYLMRNKSYLPEYERLSSGLRIGQWDLSFEDFCQLPFLLPPLSEQQQIADYLDQKCSEIDALITKKEQLVVELESYKKSLIYEVVTGKREV